MKNTKVNRSQLVFWLVYIALLAVLLPHTAWAFSSFEPGNAQGTVTAWLAAFAFEAALAVLTHKLSERLTNVPRYKSTLRRIWFAYASPYSVGLLLTTSVSVLANLAHSVEFGTSLQIFTTYRIPSIVYSVAFGAILPIASLLFAWVLSQENTIERDADNTEQLTNAHREEVKELSNKLRKAELQTKEAEARASLAEQSAAEAEHQAKVAKASVLNIEAIIEALSQEAKGDRIRAIASLPVELTGSQIAKLSGSSPAYVSEVLNKNGSGK